MRTETTISLPPPPIHDQYLLFSPQKEKIVFTLSASFDAFALHPLSLPNSALLQPAGPAEELLLLTLPPDPPPFLIFPLGTSMTVWYFAGSVAGPPPTSM